MLKITEKQRAAFSQDQRLGFEARMVKHVRRRFPAQAGSKSPSALEQFVRETVSDAISHGVRLEYDVRRYVEHVVSHGQDFIQSQRAVAILSDPKLDGTTKMDLVDDLEVFGRMP